MLNETTRERAILFARHMFCLSVQQLPVQLTAAELVCKHLHCGSGSDYSQFQIQGF